MCSEPVHYVLPALDLKSPDEEQIKGKIANKGLQSIRALQNPNAGLFIEGRSASPSSDSSSSE